MARIVVVTSSPPFVEGGHLVMARALVQALRDEGHESELIVTPQNRFGRQGSAYLATWLTDVGVGHDGRAVDQVISLRYPSYAIRHPNHVCWLNHTMREYYDQWDRFSAPLRWKGRIKETVRRRIVHVADGYLLRRHVRRLFVLSRTVQARLERWNNLASEVLYPPAPQRAYRCEEYGDYIFAVSRLAPLKRTALLIEALARPEAAGIRCVIAGEGEEAGSLQHAIDQRSLNGRVTLVGRLDERELVEHLARCRAVCFPPFDEDYGFVTVEAFACSKPVVTCTDSGGPAELVSDGVSGFVCPPRPETVALAMSQLMQDSQLASRMGQAGFQRASAMSWSQAVKRLLAV